MLLTWLIVISIISILLLITTGVLSALSLNSTVNGNSTSSRNFAWWSAGIAIFGIILLIILLGVYAFKESDNRATGLFIFGIIAILFLLGITFLSIFAARGTVSPIIDYPLWSAVISFLGAILILIFVIFYAYTYWYEIVAEISYGLKKHVKDVEKRGLARYTRPGKSPQKITSPKKVLSPRSQKIRSPPLPPTPVVPPVPVAAPVPAVPVANINQLSDQPEVQLNRKQGFDRRKQLQRSRAAQQQTNQDQALRRAIEQALREQQ